MLSFYSFKILKLSFKGVKELRSQVEISFLPEVLSTCQLKNLCNSMNSVFKKHCNFAKPQLFPYKDTTKKQYLNYLDERPPLFSLLLELLLAGA